LGRNSQKACQAEAAEQGAAIQPEVRSDGPAAAPLSVNRLSHLGRDPAGLHRSNRDRSGGFSRL